MFICYLTQLEQRAQHNTMKCYISKGWLLAVFLIIRTRPELAVFIPAVQYVATLPVVNLALLRTVKCRVTTTRFQLVVE